MLLLQSTLVLDADAPGWLRAWRGKHNNACYGTMTRADFNEIFVDAYNKHRANEEERLRTTGVNAVTRAWTNVGLNTGDRHCEFWARAIAMPTATCSLA